MIHVLLAALVVGFPAIPVGQGIRLGDSPGSAGQCLISNGPGVETSWGSCAAGGGYATIQDEGGALTVRTILNFTGAGVTCVDNGGATRTDCTIPGGGTGDVVGPASATDNAIARFDGTTGKLIQNSGLTISDAAAVQLLFPASDTVIGRGPHGTPGTNTVILGDGTLGTTTDATSVGTSANVSALRGSAFGFLAAVSGARSVALGYNTTAGNADAIALGPSAVTTAANQMVVGGNNSPITDIYFGEGVTDNPPPALVTINASGGSGLDIAPSALRLAAGKGTGAGAGSALYLATASVIGSSSTLQTLVDRALFGGTTTSSFLYLGNPDIDATVATPIANVTISGTIGSGTTPGSDVTLRPGNTLGNGRAGDLYLRGGSTLSAGIDRAGDVQIIGGDTTGSGAQGAIRFTTTGGGTIERMTLQSNNITWHSSVNLSVNGSFGTSGQVLTSGGVGSPITWTTPAAGGGGSGNTTVDFGAYPADPIATRVITGQAGIASGSVVQAWVYPLNTADHTLDEHLLENIRVYAHTIVAGTGFTITAVYQGDVHSGLGAMNGPRYGGGQTNQVQGARTYGQWSVAWRWQ